jgi:uncharacterized protein (TIGR00369 family)
MAEADPTPDPEPGQADFWREPIRGGHPDPQQLSLPGLEQLRALMSGESPEAPLSRLTGMRLEAVDPGRARFRMPLTGWLAGADGLIAPGPLSIPADAAMACAIMSELPPGTPFTTSEMTLRVLRPVRPGGAVTAVGRVISAGPPAALAEVELHDDAGALVAHGSSLCMTLPAITSPAGSPGSPGHQGATEASTPDPWQRPAPDPGIAPAGESGLDQLHARLAGKRVPAPVERFFALAPVSASRGEVVYSLPASPWFCAPPPGRLQGGVIITLLETAMFGAARTTLPAGHPLHPVECKINLLRPLASDGATACARGELVHAGRRVAVVRGELSDAGGRAIAVATGSALLGEAATGAEGP